MVLHVEAEQIVAEQAVQDLFPHGQTRNASRFGHGMCQNWQTVTSGRASFTNRGSSAK